MRKFNVIVEDQGRFAPYDIMEYLLDKWKESDIKPYSFKETREFIKKEAKTQFEFQVVERIFLEAQKTFQKLHQKIFYIQLLLRKIF